MPRQFGVELVNVLDRMKMGAEQGKVGMLALGDAIGIPAKSSRR